ncbi:hypothetical protein SAMN05421839_10642 [Halolactibacillus halophilus]|uniref:Uncharacterized protein n=1 Tax=Halolactibacillus halophilus TaxID=306540 RepID=A0A1I5MPK4_9BACI|nr:hypothetical protein [Halolactibacillus halophilus]GEM02887.1 hypothetical protein HHA03_24190 [Halolactibacillus halophilus]SFP11470.1 hypothetical protein SAMN05421839_10642 [Halolactibacillus halophilus]
MNFLTYIAFTTFTASLVTASITIALALKIGSTRNINKVLIDQIGAHIECTNLLIEKQYIEGNYEALNKLLVNQLTNYRDIRKLLKEDKHEY